MAKYNVQERIAFLTSRAEDLVATEMLSEFKRVLLAQFKLRKNNIEDWQDLDETKLEQLQNRLRVIADKSDWSMNNLLDMALISALLWNEEINGN
jgi:hypothetical protein